MNQHASMNRVYRLIWSEVRSAWVPVAETARGQGKSGRGRAGRARSIAGRSTVAAAISLALSPLALTPLAGAAPAPAHTSPAASAPCAAPGCGPAASSATIHPQGGKVVSGNASITQVGNTTDIRQSSEDVTIDWLSFSIGAQSSVDFIQPSASAVAVNRISGANGSEILGHLDANGQVYLINPNGILFGKGSQVNVGGLVASTLDATGSGGSGSHSFEGSGTGSIVNQGTISAANGGYVALLGNRVSNEGVITAQLGTVALGSGSAVTLDFSGDRLVHLQVDRSTLNDLAENKQLIEADGGLVIMTAGAQRSLLASVVNNSGIIEARTVENHAGTIELLGGMSAGTVKVAGTLDASAPEGGNGGFIETNAGHVEVSNEAKVTTASSQGLTGSWLIDPEDFTVAPSGGDISGATLSGELATTSVTLESSAGSKAPSGSGNVNIDDTVSWSANTKLTLTASNNVNVNENITATGSTAALAIDPNTANGTQTASGTGTFNLRAGAALVLTGADESLSISTASYTLGVGSVINLANVSPNSTTALTIGGVSYTVINSLGAAGSTTGTDLQGIEGKLSGHYALGSNIDASATAMWNANGATNPNAGFTPIGTAATPFTGTLDGLGHTINDLTIDRPGTNDVGLIGVSSKASVIRNVAMLGGSVTGASYVGALVGSSGGVVSESYATSSVAGSAVVGDLLGQSGGAVSESYASGNVSGTGNGIGGLIGQANSAISDSYATGNVTSAGIEVGGLAGKSLGAISDSYATGSVKGSGDAGGLVGYNIGAAATITTSYAKGSVSGSGSTIGGLAGNNTGSVAQSFWDTTTSGQNTSAGGTPLTTAQMQTAADLPGFSFTTTPDASGNAWVLIDANGTLNNASGAQGATFPMLASEYTTRIDNAHQLQLMAMNPAASYDLSQNIDASTTGTGTDVWGSSGFVPIGSASAPFTGTFDGLLHTVSGLTINLPTSVDVGLFAVASKSSVIEELGLVGGSISGSSYVGALVGNAQGVIDDANATSTVTGASSVVGGLIGETTGTVTDSYASGSVTGGGNGVGGLVGGNNGSISNSYATATVVGSKLEVGGLAGQNQGSVVDSYAVGSVQGSGDVGGLVGYNVGAHAAIGTSYAAGAVSPSGSNVGGLVGVNTGNVAESYWDTTTSGQSASAGGIGATGLSATQMQTAASFAAFNFTTTPYASGNNWVMVDFNGGLNNQSVPSQPNLAAGALGAVLPMLASEYSTTITNDHQLQLMGMNLGASYILGQNIDASRTGTTLDVWSNVGFVPIGVYLYDSAENASFNGTLNGQGHTVNGLTINFQFGSPVPFSSAGLLGQTGKGALVENVGMTGGSIFGQTENAGALVGFNEGTVTDSFSTVAVNGTYSVGGLVGYNQGTVSNSYTSFNETGPADAGGLVGTNGLGGIITNSHATGNVASGGGLVGVNTYTGTITNSYATGNVTSGGGLVGANGQRGHNYGTITNSYATGNVTSGGGLVDVNWGTINNSYATGKVNGGAGIANEKTYAGGLVAINYGTGAINQSYAKGSVSGASYVGGLIGWNAGGVSASNASGQVAGAVVGGLVGGNAGSINNGYATGNASGGTVGGLVGSNGGAITSSHATGQVTGTTAVGGLVGQNGASIASSYATGNVSGATDVGGLVGEALNSTISGSYATGNVSGATDVGGLVGFNDSRSTLSSSYAAGSVTGTGAYVGGLVGTNSGDPISSSYAVGPVSGADYVGGLVGYNVGTGGSISSAHATGSVSGGGNYVGGLVGYSSSPISSSYASGKVTGASYIGGLVGYSTGQLSVSYASGNVTGTNDVGGLIGDNVGSITNTYATGAVNGSSNVGGLVGINTGTVSTSYAVGAVSATSQVGGLVGTTSGAGAVTASFWDVTTSHLTTSEGGIGMTTAQMQTEANFVSATAANDNINPGWNFTSVWYMTNGVTYPMLLAFKPAAGDNAAP